jgi:predicted esterase YcpF (UPF0227 family)
MQKSNGKKLKVLYEIDEPVELLLTSGSEKLYIFFGGISTGISMPPFEFYNSARILEYSKIFIRDFEQSWYHAGLRGISNDLHSTCDYLHSVIQELSPKKCIFVGNSMGGYAAILFHTLLGIGEAIAFAPQTFISPFMRLRYRDRRWKAQIFRTYRVSVLRAKVWDLKPLMMRKGSAPKVSIFVSTDDAMDYVHAMHLKDVPGVRIFERSGGGHGVVKLLRNNGELPAIMSGAYP